MSNPSKNSPVAEQVKDLMSSDTTPIALKCSKTALAALDTAGGVLGWQNPEDVAIIVQKVILDITSPVGVRLK